MWVNTLFDRTFFLYNYYYSKPIRLLLSLLFINIFDIIYVPGDGDDDDDLSKTNFASLATAATVAADFLCFCTSLFIVAFKIACV